MCGQKSVNVTFFNSPLQWWLLTFCLLMSPVTPGRWFCKKAPLLLYCTRFILECLCYVQTLTAKCTGQKWAPDSHDTESRVTKVSIFQPAIANASYSLSSHGLMPGFKVQPLPPAASLQQFHIKMCLFNATWSPNLSRASLGVCSHFATSKKIKNNISLVEFLLLFFPLVASKKQQQHKSLLELRPLLVLTDEWKVDESGMWREGGGVSGCVTASLRN